VAASPRTSAAQWAPERVRATQDERRIEAGRPSAGYLAENAARTAHLEEDNRQRRLSRPRRCRAWVKERLRMLLACTDLDTADTARGLLGITVVTADLPGARRLRETINDWWDEIETFIEARVTNARTKAANTAIKHIKRTGRGYRNRHYQARILLRSHRQTRRRRTRLNQQAATASCG
jgi:hypothetical protein